MSTDSTKVMADRMWKTSRNWVGPDGSGSLPRRSGPAAKALKESIEVTGAKSVLDAGCGSCAWQLKAIPDGVSYQGVDVRKFDNWPEQCSVMNILDGPLPKADLVIVRDVLIHLTDEEIMNVLERARECARYLLVTTNARTTPLDRKGCRLVKFTDFMNFGMMIKEFEDFFDIDQPNPVIVHHHQLWDLHPE
jgi:hypothetical protein